MARNGPFLRGGLFQPRSFAASAGSDRLKAHAAICSSDKPDLRRSSRCCGSDAPGEALRPLIVAAGPGHNDGVLRKGVPLPGSVPRSSRSPRGHAAGYTTGGIRLSPAAAGLSGAGRWLARSTALGLPHPAAGALSVHPFADFRYPPKCSVTNLDRRRRAPCRVQSPPCGLADAYSRAASRASASIGGTPRRGMAAGRGRGQGLGGGGRCGFDCARAECDGVRHRRLLGGGRASRLAANRNPKQLTQKGSLPRQVHQPAADHVGRRNLLDG